MFADFSHRRISPKKSATKLSKIVLCLRYKAKPDLVIDLTEVGSTLSLEEHQLHAWAGPLFAGLIE